MIMDKKLLRIKYKKIRDGIDNKTKTILDKKITDNFINSDFKNYNNYFIYNSFKSEVSTKSIVCYLKENNKNIFFPKIFGKDMFFVKYQGQAMIKNNLGIFEPTGEITCIQPDIVLVPMLSGDKSGVRLGYGGGYYDKFLKGKNCLKIGLLYSECLSEKLPFYETDIKMDFIITENNIIRINI